MSITFKDDNNIINFISLLYLKSKSKQDIDNMITNIFSKNTLTLTGNPYNIIKLHIMFNKLGYNIVLKDCISHWDTEAWTITIEKL